MSYATEDYCSAGAAKSALPVMPPRTFQSLNNIGGRLRAIRRQLDDMLDRISPQPKQDAPEMVGLSLAGQPYASALDDIDREIDRIGSLIESIERHV